jgi:DNA polymerase III subunit delta'
MKLHDLEGHEPLRRGFARALRERRLPPVLLLHGPAGVGKQRLALWVGQLLLCETPTEEGPCGRCRSCSLALRVEHPDLHWYLPVRRPPSRGSPEREQEALEEARGELLADRRQQPLYPSHSEEVRGLHLGTIRNLRREANRKPGMAPRRLFLIANAEELVAQDSSAGAANAMLKLLEEPPSQTWFVLTSSEPGRLLPTIRSRATAVYLPPLPPGRTREFLSRRLELPSEEIDRAVALSGGSIGRALGFLPEGDERGPLEQVRREAFEWLRASLEASNTRRFSVALSTAPSGARGLHELLSSLEGWLRDLSVVGSAPGTLLLNEDGREWLSRVAREKGIHPVRAARAVERVEHARTLAAGNVNPQLLVSGLLMDLHAELTGSPAP